jgi:hypothetical protein
MLAIILVAALAGHLNARHIRQSDNGAHGWMHISTL